MRPIDIQAVARRFEAMDREEIERRRERHRRAQEELRQALAYILANHTPRRVRVWGSVLRADRFTEQSDIDICVEGIVDPVEWSRLERGLLDIVTLPLDLVQWESLIAPHREAISERGTVVYESDQ